MKAWNLKSLSTKIITLIKGDVGFIFWDMIQFPGTISNTFVIMSTQTQNVDLTSLFNYHLRIFCCLVFLK